MGPKLAEDSGSSHFNKFDSLLLLSSSPSPTILHIMDDECQKGDSTAREALSYRIGGLFGILLAGLIGFILPVVFSGRFKFVFFLFQTFAAGVVLSVGIVHVLPEATEVMKSPCLGLSSEFPWGPVLALTSALLTFVAEHSLRMMGEKAAARARKEGGGEGAQVNSLEDGQVVSVTEKSIDIQNRRIIAYTLEMGIIFHSIFIGLSLGTSRDISYVQGLAFALLFHQGFEGLALGGALSKAKLSFFKLCSLGFLFVLTCPLGVAIGIFAGNSYNENSKTLLGINGVFNSLSAGILIYNALVDLLVPAFMDEEGESQRGTLETICGFITLLGGGACMSLIAKWA